MIKSKSITVICIIAIVLAVIFTCLFASGKLDFISKNSSDNESPYAEKLFDRSYVHSINIEVNPDDWQNMIDNASSEEYISCNVNIDGENVKNVGIRPKGNTSLSNVKSLNSERYSFKIEFDQYDNDINYYGLDKFCLNNIIQDNTYMKDYFSYVMMNKIGADAPLCSYIYIKVNNEDWGLYLAVEAVEEAFAKRKYGTDFGEFYKPESMAMGGGMGKDNKEQGGMGGGKPPEDMMNNHNQGAEGNTPQAPNANIQAEGNAPQAPNTNAQAGGKGQEDGGHGMGGKGSNSVALIYQDDNIDSYSAIFDYSIFNPDTTAKMRLINSIKQLNNGENIDKVVNTDEVLRYFVAHNFTDNFDSYTGSMMHNYYLYEKDGMMSMIAWDYNLAFGGFSMGGGGGRGRNTTETSSTDTATQMVNYPIDTPTSGATLENRPMLGKLLENEEYMNRYHELFNEFISSYFESGDFTKEYNRVYNMIAEYVQKDPTKFCTFDEFNKGADTLKQFCTLRAESVRGQLNGEIPSTSDGQSADSSSLINASAINISDMGSMGIGGGPGGDKGNGQDGNNQNGGGPGGEMFDTDKLAEMLGMDAGELEGKTQEEIRSLMEEKVNNGELNMSPRGEQIVKTTSEYIIEYSLLGGSFLLIIIAIIFAIFFKRRKF